MGKKSFLFIIVAPTIAIILALAQVFYLLSIWSYEGETISFRVKPGEAFSSINYRLKKAGVIKSAKLFHRYAQGRGLMTSFQKGLYEITPGMSSVDIVEMLTSGETKKIKITLPEGKNLFEMAEFFEEAGIASESEFIQLAKDASFAQSLQIPANRLEGYLYPETYFFSPDTNARVVLKTMVETFRQKTRDLDFTQTKLTPHQVVTLASIVEKETGASFERPTIAGVFHNRLKKGMRLQSDPTTIYGIFERFNGNLRKKHLREKTPYNTYRISGLPQGPISNPGIESIKAVLSPEDHKYLYFVSQNDGTHIFSENYRQHVNAVNKYQKDRRQRQGKSWRDLSDN